jgi:predicted Holliday junction resolvase-like endonuclease|tara:strand:- start:43 stop:300 length:258 start_codon:yes stop_codon:yes gene_type:complete
MTEKYKIKIFTKNWQTTFELETSSSMITMGQVHKEIIDYLGKNDIKWEPNKLRFTGDSKFYITYEEVHDGSRQHGTVREETEARI